MAKLKLIDTMDVLRRASESQEALEEVTADIAESTLSQDFARYAEAEVRSSNFWTAGSIATTVGTATVGYLMLSASDTPTPDLADAARALVTVPFFGLALYFARIANQHRQEAKWFKGRSVQLRTLKAYSDSLEANTRDQLRADFGRLVFSDPAAGVAPAPIEPPNTVDEAARLIERATQLARSLRPNP